MHPEAPSPSGVTPPEGLPPVKPPSGKFIAQLFLVPFLIVLGIVILLMVPYFALRGLFGFGGTLTPEQYLQNLDKSNPDVRWRAAEDLARDLLRDDRLASDPKFALDLADRLRQTLTASDAGEKALAERWRKLAADASDEDRKALKDDAQALEANRNYAFYLSGCLGHFTVPVGLPILKEIASRESGMEPKALARRRRQAAYALGNLGKNLQRFDLLSDDRKDAVIDTLEDEAKGSGERGQWAKAALERLKDHRAGKQHGPGEDFLALADAEDPFLRELVALALNHWRGTPDEEARMEEVLDRLSHDLGKGHELLRQYAEEEDAPTQTLTKYPGLEVRYNATVALARRGSAKVRLGMLKDMLDEETLRENFRRKQKDGTEVPDEAMVTQTILVTLQAVAELHKQNPRFKLAELRPLIDDLAHSKNAAVRTEAKNTQHVLDETE
jgi:hypothetical protein